MALTVDTTIPGVSVIYDGATVVGVLSTAAAPAAPDYSSTLTNIDTSLQTIATNSTSIRTSLETIATQLTSLTTETSTIASKQTAMETYLKKLKELGEGAGIHIVSPLELVTFITTYRLLVEEGKMLEWRDKQPTDKEVAKALNDIGKYVDKINQNIPRSF